MTATAGSPAPPADLAAPTLPCRALDETLAFYGAAGFALTARYDAEGYLIVRRGAVELHFFRADVDPYASYAGCYLRVAALDDWRAAFAAALAPHGGATAGIPRLRDDGDQSYGLREFHVVDPNGNLLRVGAPIRAPIRAPAGAGA
jgi:catechol 2,3-dioxygenase-like lactoylglutathione lyase family enzyme